ncbi:TPA: hypothetical protein I7745_19325 [Vibrio vulnificus]|nr:hypothetical protein [Vibrio vulnificus]
MEKNRRTILKGLMLCSIPSIYGCRVEKNSKENILSIIISDFGAIGDGINDDSLALIKSLEYLKLHGGGVLYIPKGVYAINKYIKTKVITNLRNVEIYGDGDSSVFVLHSGSLSFGSFVGLKLKDIKIIRNVKITTDFREKYQVNMSNFNDLTIENVTFDEFGVENGALPIPGSTILFLYAGRKTSVVSDDLVVGSSSKFQINNCRFYSGGDRTVNFGLRVYTEFYADETEELVHGLVSNCIFKGFNWNGLEIAGPKTREITIDKCTAHSCGLTGIEIDKGASCCTIQNTKISDLRGNIDFETYPNTAIVGVLVQGSGPLNLIGKDNVVKDITVELNDTYFDYPNDIWGVALVDVEYTLVERVEAFVFDSSPSYFLGKKLAIYFHGYRNANTVTNCSFNGFDFGLCFDKNLVSCNLSQETNIERATFIDNNDFTLFYDGCDLQENGCDIKFDYKIEVERTYAS